VFRGGDGDGPPASTRQTGGPPGGPPAGHRNTVMHRLRRIESVTVHKVTDPRARLLWQLALLGAGTQCSNRGPA
jgi:hypothetical protein